MSGLKRFIDAQDRRPDGYDNALQEIQGGKKTSHWIWYIFPQITGLGSSHNAQYYAIESLSEAQDYLNNDKLRRRLLEITHAAKKQLDAGVKILALLSSSIDVTKFRASMTLFLLAAYENGDAEAYQCFKSALKTAYPPEGHLDEATLKILRLQIPEPLKQARTVSDLPQGVSFIDVQPSDSPRSAGDNTGVNITNQDEPRPLDTDAHSKQPSVLNKAPPPIIMSPAAVVSTNNVAPDKAFQFSRVERFFQWLYNLTHASNNQIDRPALRANPHVPIGIRCSIFWKWLTGLQRYQAMQSTLSPQRPPPSHYQQDAMKDGTQSRGAPVLRKDDSISHENQTNPPKPGR
jgi:uncharacterized protein (DUF1810 family)